MRSNRFLFLVGVVSGLALGNLRSFEPAPETPKKPVSTKYQDVTVEDSYQWLEEDNDPQVKSWSDAQNQRTRQYLDKLPDRGN
jgi:protease II